MTQLNNNDLVLINPLKRFFDIFISGLILLILSPIILLIILLIKLEGFLNKKNSGPILYSETRISQGKPFTLYKFRIFKVSSYQPIRDRGEIVQTKPLEKDPGNLTRTGKLLKSFYFDEFPQLWTVLNGDMSLVGPRPWNSPDYENEIKRGIYRKKVIKAGLTGPVQIHKLDAKKFGGEYQLDINYINFCRDKRRISILLYDIKILIKSFIFMLKGQGL